MKPGNPSEISLFLIFAFLNTLIGIALYFWLPEVRYDLVKEHHFVQNLTALFFLLSTLLGFLTVFFSKGQTDCRRFLWIPLLSFFCFLEEVEYGRTLFGFESLRLVGKNVATVIDFAAVAVIFSHKHRFGGALAIGLLAIVTAISVKRGLLLRAYHKAKTYRPVRFAFVALAFGFLAALIDLHFIRFPGSHVIEEFAEMNGSLALLVSALLIRTPACGWRITISVLKTGM